MVDPETSKLSALCKGEKKSAVASADVQNLGASAEGIRVSTLKILERFQPLAISSSGKIAMVFRVPIGMARELGLDGLPERLLDGAHGVRLRYANDSAAGDALQFGGR